MLFSYNLTIAFHISSRQPPTSCFTHPWSLPNHELELTMCAMRMYFKYVSASAVKQRVWQPYYVHMFNQPPTPPPTPLLCNNHS